MTTRLLPALKLRDLQLLSIRREITMVLVIEVVPALDTETPIQLVELALDMETPILGGPGTG
jgi:hypothetical protein